MMALMLFCVMMRGRESTFASPRFSAMLKRKSRRKFRVNVLKVKPLVAADARFENRVIAPLLVPEPIRFPIPGVAVAGAPGVALRVRKLVIMVPAGPPPRP